jgi:cob(I)alamin adenosyltransferase
MNTQPAHTGDDGQTDLLGGRRVEKDHPRVELLGALDELAAHLHLAAAHSPAGWLADRIAELQALLSVACAELACPDEKTHGALKRTLADEDVFRLEAIIEQVRTRTPPVGGFLSPRREPAVQLNVARAVARRAERRLWALLRQEPIPNPVLPAAINRLSDVLFALTWSAEAEGDSTSA